MLIEEKSRTVVIARKMQGRNPRQALPGIQESFGGGRPNMYLIGPSLVIRRDRRKVAMVARSKVLGKVLR